MKRLIAFLLTLILCVSLCACGGGNSAPEATPSPTPSPAPTPVPTPSPEELAAMYNKDMAAAIGSEDRAPLTAGKAVTYWVDADGVGTYNKNFLTDEWIAETPDEAKFVVQRTEGTQKVGTYYGIGVGGDALQRYVRIEIITSGSDQTLAQNSFYGSMPPQNITKNEERFGSYPDEAEIEQWVQMTLPEVADKETQRAADAATKIMKTLQHSKASLENYLVNQHGFTPDEAAYAAENCGADWNKQALTRTKNVLKSYKHTRNDMYNQLTTDWLFTEAEANYALDNCGTNWDKMNKDIATAVIKENLVSKTATIEILTKQYFFTEEEAISVVDSCNVDWNKQALAYAKNALSAKEYSRNDLLNHLTNTKKFTVEEANYALDNCGVEWSKAADSAVQEYLEIGPQSMEGLIEFLVDYEDFSEAEARAAVESADVDWKEQALLLANDLLDPKNGAGGYSPSYLYYTLSSPLNKGGFGFTEEQAQYALDNCTADWYEQAVLATEFWINYWDESQDGELNKDSLQRMLVERDNFTEDQAKKAAESANLG